MRSKTSMRAFTLILTAAALTLAACGSSGGSGGGSSSGGGKAVSLGGPPECPSRPFCEVGLKNTYGIKISSFKSLDSGGPLTLKAIKDGTVDFGLVFTSDPTVDAQGLVVLTDDKHLQNSDNIVPIVDSHFNKAPATTALNKVQAALSQQALNGMNSAVQLQHVNPATVATGFLNAVHLDKATLCGGASGTGKVTVGAFNFSESALLANVYAAALKTCGYSTSVKQLGAREVVYPALKKGDLDLVPEYAATLTTFLKGTASPDINNTLTALQGVLPSNLHALTAAAATDQNAFAVTKAFAQAHNLTTLSDLATYSTS
jgi:osmoprotectant transport system substrate-binding protein